jgi:hypothetical protein
MSIACRRHRLGCGPEHRWSSLGRMTGSQPAPADPFPFEQIDLDSCSDVPRVAFFIDHAGEQRTFV